VLGFVDCTVHSVHEAGDHYVVLGRVRELGFGEREGKPLLYYRGSYDTNAGQTA
jgi:3-hydroxy-9,10-secoandrosta-1,3,5(10)-triene-9,17-dione monooxygenase reductase component